MSEPTILDMEAGSPAYEHLLRVMDDANTYKVSIDVRADGIAIKCNERMWTPTMKIKVRQYPWEGETK